MGDYPETGRTDNWQAFQFPAFIPGFKQPALYESSVDVANACEPCPASGGLHSSIGPSRWLACVYTWEGAMCTCVGRACTTDVLSSHHAGRHSQAGRSSLSRSVCRGESGAAARMLRE